MARPTVLDEEMRRKIDEAAQLGCSTEEIAMWCGVWRSTVYRWMKEDEELKDRIEELRERPIMKARQTIVKSLDNPDDARWYLERKRKNEFSVRNELTGADGKPLILPAELINKNDTPHDTEPSSPGHA